MLASLTVRPFTVTVTVHVIEISVTGQLQVKLRCGTHAPVNSIIFQSYNTTTFNAKRVFFYVFCLFCFLLTYSYAFCEPV